MTDYASIVDGDLLAFKAACHFENHGIDHMEERLTQDLSLWDPGLGSQIVAFSCGRKDNYRRDFWPAYKAHRDNKESPQYLRATIDWITEHYDTIKKPRIEADDILGSPGAASGAESNENLIVPRRILIHGKSAEKRFVARKRPGIYDLDAFSVFECS